MKLIKLEIWDRAQRKAARRRKSDCRDNFGWFKCRSQQRHLVDLSGILSEITPKFHLGGSIFEPITFLWTKVHYLFSSNVGGVVVVVDQLLFRFSIFESVPDIRDQTRKLSEIAPNFRRFLSSQILEGGPFPKVVPTLTPLPRGTSRGKVSFRTP